jgi:cytochrome P450
MVSYLSCTTLDIIGLAGFNYSFNSLRDLVDGNQELNELSTAFGTLFTGSTRLAFFALLKMWFPIIRPFTFDRGSLAERKAQETVRRIGCQLVNDKKKMLLEETEDKTRAKNLLTLLIKADMSEDVDKRLSDEEIMNQIPTFITAGALRNSFV